MQKIDKKGVDIQKVICYYIYKEREKEVKNMTYKKFLEEIAKGSITEEVIKKAKRLLKEQEERRKIELYSFSAYSPYDE